MQITAASSFLAGFTLRHDPLLAGRTLVHPEDTFTGGGPGRLVELTVPSHPLLENARWVGKSFEESPLRLTADVPGQVKTLPGEDSLGPAKRFYLGLHEVFRNHENTRLGNLIANAFSALRVYEARLVFLRRGADLAAPMELFNTNKEVWDPAGINALTAQLLACREYLRLDEASQRYVRLHAESLENVRLLEKELKKGAFRVELGDLERLIGRERLVGGGLLASADTFHRQRERTIAHWNAPHGRCEETP
jgi:hypothetical protein